MRAGARLGVHRPSCASGLSAHAQGDRRGLPECVGNKDEWWSGDYPGGVGRAWKGRNNGQWQLQTIGGQKRFSPRVLAIAIVVVGE
jgi:hypothetical protein